MKKICLVALLSTVCMVPIKAQIHLGLKGGLNVTSLSLKNDYIDNLFSNKTGFFVGPTIRFTLPFLGVDISALYDQREADISAYDMSNNNHTEKIKQKTLQIPVNARFAVGLGSTANIFFFAGPQFGFNVGSKSKDLFGVYEWTMNDSEFSLNFGLGALLLSHLQLSVNYNINLGKTGELKTKSSSEQYSQVETGKFNAWQIAVAYYF